jgi:hypothetical protein
MKLDFARASVVAGAEDKAEPNENLEKLWAVGMHGTGSSPQKICYE